MNIVHSKKELENPRKIVRFSEINKIDRFDKIKKFDIVDKFYKFNEIPTKGPFIKDVISRGGRGGLPNDDLT